MPTHDHTGYVDKVREEMQIYIRRLISEADTLRLLVAELESDNDRLRDEVRSAREEIAVRESHEQRLRDRISAIHREGERYTSQYLQLEQHNANLANLYVASYQLHGTLDRDAVLSAMQEIVVNLVGSEEFAIFEEGLDGTLHPVAAIGMPDTAAMLQAPLVIDALVSGETRVGDAVQDEMIACVPLALDGNVSGAIVIGRLLAHKQALETLDFELFDLLAKHAATALYCTSMRSRLDAMEMTA